jgi:tetratricopeptide (TPR) repeat protein
LIKLNQPDVASAWARTARIAADEADDPAIRSWVWAQEAYVYFYDGRLAEAVAVARHAQEGAGRAAAVGVPLAAALEARALAVLGERREALITLERAESALSRLADEVVTSSALGYNEAQLRFHEGNALTHLRDTEAAQASQQRALELYPPEDYLDRALVGLDQATCLAHQGDAEAAAEAATRAMVRLTADQRAGLVAARCREVLTILDCQRAATPEVHELRDLLTQDTRRDCAQWYM